MLETFSSLAKVHLTHRINERPSSGGVPHFVSGRSVLNSQESPHMAKRHRDFHSQEADIGPFRAVGMSTTDPDQSANLFCYARK